MPREGSERVILGTFNILEKTTPVNPLIHDVYRSFFHMFCKKQLYLAIIAYFITSFFKILYNIIFGLASIHTENFFEFMKFHVFIKNSNLSKL